LFLVLLIPIVFIACSMHLGESSPIPAAAPGEMTITETAVFGDLHITSTGGQDLISIDNCGFLSNVGEPRLPVKGLLVELPSADILNVSFEVFKKQYLGLFTFLQPNHL
jgi:hypothetical protein